MPLNKKKMISLEKRIIKIDGSDTDLKGWLYDMYINKNFSTHQISLKLSRRPYNTAISDTCIATYLHSFNIRLRTGSYRSKE